jgi:integrase
MPRQRTGGVIKRKDRGGYWARLTYIDGVGKRRVLQRKVENRTEGKLLLKQMLRKIEDQGVQIIEGDKLRFSGLAKFYEERKLTPPKYQGDVKVSGLRSYQSQQRRLKTLVKHFGKKLIRQITYSDLEQFKQERLALKTWRGEERSHADVNRDLQLMRIVLNFARRQGWLPVNPFERGEALINSAHERQRDRVLSRDEESRLLAACEKPQRKHLRSIIIALVDTALRKGELCGFLWPDVDLEAGTIRIRATIAKTAKARTVPITLRLRREFERLCEEVPYKDGEKVFGIFGDFKRAFAAACTDAGITGLRIHDLRHTGTTRMIEAGMPPAQVMVVTGHSEFSTFRRYVSADDEAVRRAGVALDEWHSQTKAETASEFLN